jgi:hypothetical protein
VTALQTHFADTMLYLSSTPGLPNRFATLQSLLGLLQTEAALSGTNPGQL